MITGATATSTIKSLNLPLPEAPRSDVYQMDCLKALKQYPDNYFDLAVVDPPYGIGIDGQKPSLNNKNPKHNRKHHQQKNWDQSTPPPRIFYRTV